MGTHTYAVLELSKAAHEEIATKLRAAGYDHSFMEDGVIDMHGIAVALEKEPKHEQTHETPRPLPGKVSARSPR
jgi:hypothetical protein